MCIAGNVINFQFIPHYYSPYFDKIREENLRDAAKELTEPVYAADDNTAVKVVDGKIEVISGGKYLILNNDGGEVSV